MAGNQLTGVQVIVNNDTVAIVPNSLVYNEGLGEQKVHAVSVGDGEVEQVFAQDIETNFGMVKFDLRSNPSSIAQALVWKQNGNENVVSIMGENADGRLIRNFTGASLTSNYDVNIGVDGIINIEFHTNAPR